jgi:hypothetical protein
MAISNSDRQAKFRANKREIERKRGVALSKIDQARFNIQSQLNAQREPAARNWLFGLDATLKDAQRALLPDEMWENIR